MGLIDCLVMTLMSAAICITLPLMLSKVRESRNNRTTLLERDLSPQKITLATSPLPQPTILRKRPGGQRLLPLVMRNY